MTGATFVMAGAAIQAEVAHRWRRSGDAVRAADHADQAMIFFALATYLAWLSAGIP